MASSEVMDKGLVVMGLRELGLKVRMGLRVLW